MLLHIIILHIFIVFLFQKYGNSNNLTQYYAAEEGTKHTIHFWFYSNTTIKTFRIENQNSYVTECSIENLSCGNESSQKVLCVLEKTTHCYHLNVTILNVTRDSEFNIEGRWTLTNLQNNFEFSWCYVKIYAKPSNITCESYMVETLLHLNCSIERIYPKAKCQFLTNNTQMNKHISTLAVKYTYYNETVKPLYYRSSCAVVLSESKFGNGTHDVLITAYPNVTGNDTDLFFGTNITHKIDLGQPGVTLRECPQVIEIGENISCLCEYSHLSLTDVSIDWFEENQQKKLKGSNVLQFKATTNSINYRCEIKNTKGNLKATAIYRPHVYIRPLNFNCRKLQTDKLVISCNTSGVYPEPRCLLIAYDSTENVKLKNEATTRNNKIQIENLTQYQSACEFSISDSLINQELRVVVTNYPNITGSETDITFGANATVTLDPVKNCFGEKCIDLSCIIAVSIIAALLVIVLTLCGVYLHKKGEIKKVLQYIQEKIHGKGDQRQSPSSGEIETQDSSNSIHFSEEINAAHATNLSNNDDDEENSKHQTIVNEIEAILQFDTVSDTIYPHETMCTESENIDAPEKIDFKRNENNEHVAIFSRINDADDANEYSPFLEHMKPHLAEDKSNVPNLKVINPSEDSATPSSSKIVHKEKKYNS